MLLLLLLVILLFLEIAFFIFVGTKIGIIITLFLIIIMLVFGGLILKYQKIRDLIIVRDNYYSNKAISNDIFDNFIIISAAILFITPGFITDILGLLLLIPIIRYFIRIYFLNSMNINIVGFNVNLTEFIKMKTSNYSKQFDIIDAPYKTLSEDDKS